MCMITVHSDMHSAHRREVGSSLICVQVGFRFPFVCLHFILNVSIYLRVAQIALFLCRLIFLPTTLTANPMQATVISHRHKIEVKGQFLQS